MFKIFTKKIFRIPLVFIILSAIFVVFSFSPSLYELYQKKNLPSNRAFVLEHNYMFDFNFYLSRIREAREGRWLVVEKYYSTPHTGSLLHILYLFIGYAGDLFRFSPTVSYHLSRLTLGFLFLLLIGKVTSKIFSGKWSVLAFLLVVTTGSWPVLVKAGNFYRFATYMGWWSAIDSLQRITFIPHILFGQIFLLLFIWKFGGEAERSLKPLKLLKWGIAGFMVGIVFPPAVLILIAVLGVQSFLELITNFLNSQKIKPWISAKILPRFILIAVSAVSLIYLALIIRVYPWKALAEFDIKHRFIMPYWDYLLALGPNAIFALLGFVLVLYRRESKFFPFVAWIIGVSFLFLVFESVPEQSALRFTESALHIPIGILSAYFFYFLWQKALVLKKNFQNTAKCFLITIIFLDILLGLLVMLSQVLWLTDQTNSKRTGSFMVPTGAQLIYPLKDFMDGITFIQKNTKVEDLVLAYETAGNYIPAYAGNFVYLGHANTPQEDLKKETAGKFFAGKMNRNEAGSFLTKENIKYIYFGPQEREFGNIKDLSKIYPFLELIYQNSQVMVYRVK